MHEKARLPSGGRAFCIPKVVDVAMLQIERTKALKKSPLKALH
jgi:hypothetical protein